MTEEEWEEFLENTLEENKKDYKKLFLLLLLFLSNKILSENKISQSDKSINNLLEHFIENNISLTKNFFRNIITSINLETNKQNDLLINKDEISSKILTNIKEEVINKFSQEKLFVLSRNELGKINFFLTREIFLSDGVESYFWQTQRDERVRISHRFLDRKICSLVDPTVYKNEINQKWIDRPSSTTHNHCGMDFNCRCYMLRI